MRNEQRQALDAVRFKGTNKKKIWINTNFERMASEIPEHMDYILMVKALQSFLYMFHKEYKGTRLGRLATFALQQNYSKWHERDMEIHLQVMWYIFEDFFKESIKVDKKITRATMFKMRNMREVASIIGYGLKRRIK